MATYTELHKSEIRQHSQMKIEPLMILLIVISMSLKTTDGVTLPVNLHYSCQSKQVPLRRGDSFWLKNELHFGMPHKSILPSVISPELDTVCSLPISAGPRHCLSLTSFEQGLYVIRVYFALYEEKFQIKEPSFDVTIDGTIVVSLQAGWSKHDDRSFVESYVPLHLHHEISMCVHNTNLGDPSILALEMLQVKEKAYEVSQQLQWKLLRTFYRLNFGIDKPEFEDDFGGSIWGGDRLWFPLPIGLAVLSTQMEVKSMTSPNVYPSWIYQTAIISSNVITFSVDVYPNSIYSIWFHFAEISSNITTVGQRIFDVYVNGKVVFKGLDIIAMSGQPYTALVVKTTVSARVSFLNIELHPKMGHEALLSAIEIFDMIKVELKTYSTQVEALLKMKLLLSLPIKLGWIGDPCVPPKHMWIGVRCRFNSKGRQWQITELRLSGLGIKGPIPSDLLLSLPELKILDLSNNSFNGTIPDLLGKLKSIKTMNLNDNCLTGRVPERLVVLMLNNRIHVNFTGNKLCGANDLPSCDSKYTRPKLTTFKKCVAFGLVFGVIVVAAAAWVFWSRRHPRGYILGGRPISENTSARPLVEIPMVSEQGSNDQSVTLSSVRVEDTAASEQGSNEPEITECIARDRPKRETKHNVRLQDYYSNY